MPRDDYDEYAACDALLAAWRKPGAAHNDAARDALIEAAIKADNPDVVDEVDAGGPVANAEIKLPVGIKNVPASVLRNLGEMPLLPYWDDKRDFVIRRMTKTRFEVWTPAHGWLFDSNGRLLDEAKPPRRDGSGREWHGAFLPDGSWVTTDLWDWDRTLTFFSPKGKWLKEIASRDLAPADGSDRAPEDLIAWARCDRTGAGWVVCVGSEGGRAHVFVPPHGKPRILENTGDPCDKLWRLCYPRDLEPKGMFTSLVLFSDDYTSTIAFAEAGHGPGVGFPDYQWNDSVNAVIAGEDHDFGFWPGSHDVFIGASRDHSDQTRPARTWFFDSHRKCQGWICGEYLCDSADGKAMCFLDDDDSVVTLGKDLKVRSRTAFTIDGIDAEPAKLFTDLGLGFFLIGKKLALARASL